MRIYETECLFKWARGVALLQGIPGEIDILKLNEHFSKVKCWETSAPLPQCVVQLAALIQSGLPDKEDYQYFLLHYPEGEVKEKMKDHFDYCRRSKTWYRYWKGYVR